MKRANARTRKVHLPGKKPCVLSYCVPGEKIGPGVLDHPCSRKLKLKGVHEA